MLSEGAEAEQQIYEVLRMLYESIGEFLDERVAPDAQSYANHFLALLDDIERDGTREQFENEGARFVEALKHLEAKLKSEYLEPEQIRSLFDLQSIGQKLHQTLESAIQNRVNEVAAPALERIMTIVRSGRFG